MRFFLDDGNLDLIKTNFKLLIGNSAEKHFYNAALQPTINKRQ